jgi:hypothetical protein
MELCGGGEENVFITGQGFCFLGESLENAAGIRHLFHGD